MGPLARAIAHLSESVGRIQPGHSAPAIVESCSSAVTQPTPGPIAGQDSVCVLHRFPAAPIEAKWRACLTSSDYPSHYTAPEYFLEPALRDQKPFAILSLAGDEVTAVLTGINDRGRVQSGLSVRPQIAFTRRADRHRALANLSAGFLEEAQSAQLVDLFVWSDIAQFVDPRFRRRQYDGAVMLDLTRGPDALFRKFSENKRTNIKKAIKLGVNVDVARNRDEISAFYAICVDWWRRKGLPIVGEEEFQETFSLTGNRRLWLAQYRGEIVAGVVVRRGDGIRSEQLPPKRAAVATERSTALACNRMGVRRRDDQIQSRRYPPLLA
jgi:FemAB family